MFDTMVYTKALGALCGALLIFLLGKWVADEIYRPINRGAEQAFVIDTGVEEAEPVAELTFDEAFMLASADAGQRLWSQCRACHALDEGRNGVGPYLYNVMGRQANSVEGFNYSGALPDVEWTPVEMSAFLENPRGYAPGTSMSYSGMSGVQDRANLIAYLIDNSPDYDAPTDAALVVDEAPAEDEAVAEAPAEEAPAEDEAVAEAPTEEAPAEDEAVAEAPAEEAMELSAFAIAVAEADPADGQRVFRQCQACHVANAPTNRVGPHMVDLVGREIGSVEGFRYSGNLPEGIWTLGELDAFLENPRGYAPGTSMVFQGLRSMDDRAAVIAFIEAQ